MVFRKSAGSHSTSLGQVVEFGHPAVIYGLLESRVCLIGMQTTHHTKTVDVVSREIYPTEVLVSGRTLIVDSRQTVKQRIEVGEPILKLVGLILVDEGYIIT